VTRRTSSIDHRSWERLLYRDIPVKLHVLADLPAPTAPLLEGRAWQSFQQQCAEDGNVIPRLIAALEPQDPGMFQRRRPRRPKGSDPFSDLPPAERLKAEEEFARLCRRWEPDLPPWRRAVLAGNARQLTLQPRSSEWGKRMRRTKGGVHCQQKYANQGGHALAAFNQAMTGRRKDRLDACEGGEQGSARALSPAKEARTRLGITPDRMKGRERIARTLKAAGCAPDRAVDALRYSSEEDARRFLAKHDSIPPADLQHLSIDEISVAAGVDPRRLLLLVVDGMMWISAKIATMKAALRLPDVMRELIRRARTKRGWRERRLLFEFFQATVQSRTRAESTE
jgi:hypothetical protein